MPALPVSRPDERLATELRLPLALASQYLFFLSRRPISRSNRHYLERRLAGIKSLCEPLAACGEPALEALVRKIGRLQPASFARLAPGLQLGLLPWMERVRRLPEEVVVLDGPPAPGALAETRRVLVVFGPGIGIGDEIIFFPLPRWLRGSCPRLSELDVLSGYDGLWQEVAGVDRAGRWKNHREILGALRGEAPHDGYDLVLFADFETPDLYRALCAERPAFRYVELSLGSRSAFVLEPGGDALHRVHHVTPYFENYYAACHHLLRSLGLAVREGERFESLSGRPAGESGDGDGTFRIFVSPFTSKYEPSLAYWSRLLAELAAEGGPRPLRFVIDPGVGRASERMARALERSAAARLPAGVTAGLAGEDGRRRLSLPAVLRLLASCRAVVCADSYAAHAAPHFGCLTLVVAQEGLEPWRVPSDRSFYFRAEDPVDEVAAAMHEVLRSAAADPGSAEAERALFTRAEERLLEACERLAARLEDGGDGNAASLVGLHSRFVAAQALVVGALGRGRHDGSALFRDTAYRPLPAAVPERPGGGLAPGGETYLRDQLERWRNTNLQKYLSLSLGRRPPQGAPEERP